MAYLDRMPDAVAVLAVVVDHHLLLRRSAGVVACPSRLLVRHGQHDGIGEGDQLPGAGTVLGGGSVADAEEGAEVIEGRVEAQEEPVDDVHSVLREDAAHLLEVMQQADEFVSIGLGIVEGARAAKCFEVEEDALRGCGDWFFEDVLEGLEHGGDVGQILKE